MANNVYLITLTSGTTILTCAVHEDDKTLLLKDPLEVHFDLSTQGVEQFFVSRWNAFSENYTSLVYKSAVESLTVCSDRFKELYNKKIAIFQASASLPEDTVDTTVTESDDPSDEVGDGSEEDEDTKSPITYH